jgi:pumilio homology domain family member 6
MAATQKSSKKRPATTQSGPISKKVHLDKSAKEKDIGAEKKRSRPITLPVQEENSESEDIFDELDGGEDDVGLDATLDADGMDVHSSNAPPKDPNGMFVGFFYATMVCCVWYFYFYFCVQPSPLHL